MNARAFHVINRLDRELGALQDDDTALDDDEWNVVSVMREIAAGLMMRYCDKAEEKWRTRNEV